MFNFLLRSLVILGIVQLIDLSPDYHKGFLVRKTFFVELKSCFQKRTLILSIILGLGMR